MVDLVLLSINLLVEFVIQFFSFICNFFKSQAKEKSSLWMSTVFGVMQTENKKT